MMVKNMRFMGSDFKIACKSTTFFSNLQARMHKIRPTREKICICQDFFVILQSVLKSPMHGPLLNL